MDFFDHKKNPEACKALHDTAIPEMTLNYKTLNEYTHELNQREALKQFNYIHSGRKHNANQKYNPSYIQSYTHGASAPVRPMRMFSTSEGSEQKEEMNQAEKKGKLFAFAKKEQEEKQTEQPEETQKADDDGDNKKGKFFSFLKKAAEVDKKVVEEAQGISQEAENAFELDDEDISFSGQVKAVKTEEAAETPLSTGINIEK